MEKQVIGGQAIIEGVMMRSPHFYSIAIRRKSGEIDLKVESFSSITSKYKILSLPFIRGIVALIEAMILGIKTLSYSADIYSLDYDDKIDSKIKNPVDSKKKSATTEIIISMLLSLLFGVFLFVIIPLILANFIKAKFNLGFFSFNIVDGIIRLLIFFTYIFLISFIKDIRRVFEYHGAEHKAVFAYENESDNNLDVEHTKKYSTLHPRCGTNFMFIVIVLSILIISIFKVDSFFLKFLLRIVALPLIAGLSYEVIKFLGNNFDKKWTKKFFSVGLLLQKITTKNPNDEQIEIALIALKAVLEKEKNLN